MATNPRAATRASTRAKPSAAPTAAIPTRTTRARTGTAKDATTASVAEPVPKKQTLRKPLVNRDNVVETPAVPKVVKAPSTRKLGKAATNASFETEREPIMAYLRIRPHLGDAGSAPTPYLTPLSDTSVRMTDPQESQGLYTRFRPSYLPTSSLYTFSHIFPTDTTQSEFFVKTTLPLVRDVLEGQNALLFTYGVTNSGKTYTVQGGSREGSAGILPRTLDVIFNSIKGLQGDGRYRPVRLHGVEPADSTDSRPPPVAPEPALAAVLGQDLDSPSAADIDIDPTIIKVDRNYEYTVWLSYAEVYNEKVFDLLASVKNDGESSNTSSIPRPAQNNGLVLHRNALPLKPSPASDGDDSGLSGKYIAGLRQFRVHSASQAKALVKLGQLHRRVFGTLANRESSRSHGMVFVKIVRGHRGERNDPTSLQISRLTLVDLAGSERTKHTQTTGERLKEAGSINKSLMVLGQCMEVMRSNQRKVAVSLAHEGIGKEGRVDTRDVKKGLAVVPFRHSKLTEVLMDYFVGDGRAVMIVNVNPYDTGYDENSHVMKFAALAREVYVTPAPAPIHRVATMTGPGKLRGNKIKELGPLTLKDPDIAPLPFTRKVTISMNAPPGKKPRETVLEVLEEDEPAKDDRDDDDDGDDEPSNPLIDALFDEVEDLRIQLFESEMRCAVIEAETREEIMREMEERMRNMEQMYSRRLMKELEQNELKTDAKIDMLHQSGLFGSPVKKQSAYRNVPDDFSEGEERDVELSLIEEDDEEDGPRSRQKQERFFDANASPLAAKGKTTFSKGRQSSLAPQYISEMRPFVPDPPMLPSDIEDAESTENEEGPSVGTTMTTESEEESIEGEEGDEDLYTEDDDEDEDDDDEFEPSSYASHNNKTPRPKPAQQRQRKLSPSPVRASTKTNSQVATQAKGRVSKLEREMHQLTLTRGEDIDDSIMVVPVKNAKSRALILSEEEDEDELDLMTVKKKKRQLGKKPIVTEEEIERYVEDVGHHALKKSTSKTRNGR